MFGSMLSLFVSFSRFQFTCDLHDVANQKKQQKSHFLKNYQDCCKHILRTKSYELMSFYCKSVTPGLKQSILQIKLLINL